ncbi:hypothetical protein [Calothrix sp. NIES-3974]|nr:hypothetical protein [Calothrix sp. NIES-3974]BAZ07619.1 hypothetical protein NIES3974_42830 [Calothrix sp. NIES-3974]
MNHKLIAIASNTSNLPFFDTIELISPDKVSSRHVNITPVMRENDFF